MRAITEHVSWSARIVAGVAAIICLACNGNPHEAARPAASRASATELVRVQPSKGRTEESAGLLVKMDGEVLWRNAKNKPMPHYPHRALVKAVSGVAVASIMTDPSGQVTSVDILEAPDGEIGNAVREALLQWSFLPVQIQGSAENRRVTAKLTFYFRVVNGKGVVLSPDEMRAAER